MTTEDLKKGNELYERMKAFEEISDSKTSFIINYNGFFTTGGAWKNMLQESDYFSQEDIREVGNVIREYFRKKLEVVKEEFKNLGN